MSLILSLSHTSLPHWWRESSWLTILSLGHLILFHWRWWWSSWWTLLDLGHTSCWLLSWFWHWLVPHHRWWRSSWGTSFFLGSVLGVSLVLSKVLVSHLGELSWLHIMGGDLLGGSCGNKCHQDIFEHITILIMNLEDPRSF